MPTSAPTRLATVLLLALACAAPGAGAAGLDFHTDADLADIGLPVYPGAVKKPQKGADDAGVSFGLWGAAWGLKIDALNFRSDAEVEDVAAFYRAALGRLGPVLDCTNHKAEPPPAAPPKKPAKDAPVTCGDGSTATPGSRLYKVGTEADNRSVGIEPRAHGSSFMLVRLQRHGLD
jgi:hypothetical protein